MAGRPRTRLAQAWADEMLAVLRATRRPWATDDLAELVCGRNLSPLEQEAARMAVDRLHSLPSIGSGEQHLARNGRQAGQDERQPSAGAAHPAGARRARRAAAQARHPAAVPGRTWRGHEPGQLP